MEAAEPIQFITPKPHIDNEKIDFIEELKAIKGNENYTIQFGLKENKNELTIKVISENSKDIYYFQQSYTLYVLQNLSKIFALYETVKEIILFLKNLKFEIEERNENLILKFNAFLPDGKSKLIELELKKNLVDVNQVIKNLFEEIKFIKINMQKEKQDCLNRELNYKKEIKNLNQYFLNRELNYKKEISDLKEENKKLWNEINKLKNSKEKNKIIEENKIYNFDSKIIDSINKIDFILNYIRDNDKSFNFKEIKLLYRGSRDGDRTKTCHELCDYKQNVLVVILSDTGYIFGGYSKIGFKTTINDYTHYEYKKDNNSFLFSVNLKKIYPVIKDKEAICHISDRFGLGFTASLAFYDNFMNNSRGTIFGNDSKEIFSKPPNKYEMNGGNRNYKCSELEVFQLV